METETRFYKAEDIMAICECSRYMAYKLIRQWNKELQEKGYTTIAGKVVKGFAEKKLGFLEIKND